MVLGGLPIWFALLSAFILGSVIGSFLNVCVHRLPDHYGILSGWKGLFHPPSRCPRCLHPIRLIDNVPILGWIKLGGRCFNCRKRISPRYPIVELFNGLLWMIMYMVEIGDFRPTMGPLTGASSLFAGDLSPAATSGSPWTSAEAILHLRYLYHMVLLETLLVASLIDFDLRIIPDSVTVPAMGIGLLGSLLGTVYIFPIWFQDRSSVSQVCEILAAGHDSPPAWLEWIREAPRMPGWVLTSPHLHGLATSVAGLVVGGGVIWLVRIAGHWVLKQEAMGFGDVTLMAAIGSFIGWQAVLAVFFIAPLFAIVFALANWFLRRERELPYGPFLAMGTLFLLYAFKHIWPNLEATFGWGPFLVVLLSLGAASFVPLLMLTRLVRRALGIPDPSCEAPLTWRPADQLHYLAGEQVDPRQGRWPAGPENDWPGQLSGRGMEFESRWRQRP
tara:strand:- start:247 stop:1581 length:1335 start_codon:yes stop_codon:yes gene_type:complete